MGNGINVDMVEEEEIPENIKESLMNSMIKNTQIVQEEHAGVNPFGVKDDRVMFNILKVNSLNFDIYSYKGLINFFFSFCHIILTGQI